MYLLFLVPVFLTVACAVAYLTIFRETPKAEEEAAEEPTEPQEPEPEAPEAPAEPGSPEQPSSDTGPSDQG